ncbi:MAG: hypothetical protein QOF51_627 [Chloroflexota bacterium]|jgi:uncharacterized protein GlcG (DUF336 family)/NAD-dependent dihydropyrimidine dehydrogenase PreA subunit|nr:hypothetical protein [Chloroflexota bacterium]
MTYVIAEPCIEEKNASCVEVCPVACIHTTPDSPQYYIDPDVCIECEQCKIVCPVEAIYLDYNLPDNWKDFVEVNARFFRTNKAAIEPVFIEQAWEIIRGAEAYAREIGSVVSVAVVDQSGAPIALSRMDGAAPHTAELALNKAYTSINFQLATHQIGRETRQPWFYSLMVTNRGRIMAGGGGMTILDGPVLIGAIGVAGNGRDEDDVLCCRAGLAVREAPGH